MVSLAVWVMVVAPAPPLMVAMPALRALRSKVTVEAPVRERASTPEILAKGISAIVPADAIWSVSLPDPPMMESVPSSVAEAMLKESFPTPPISVRSWFAPEFWVKVEFPAPP